MLLAILAAYFGYKKGDESGRNGLLWAAICAGAFIGTQLGIGIFIGLGLGLGVGFFGWSDSVFEKWEWIVNLVAIAASIFVVWLIFRYLDRIPEPEPEMAVPPPPEFVDRAEPKPDIDIKN